MSTQNPSPVELSLRGLFHKAISHANSPINKEKTKINTKCGHQQSNVSSCRCFFEGGTIFTSI